MKPYIQYALLVISIIILTGCIEKDFYSSSLDNDELEKVSAEYLRTTETEEDRQVEPNIKRLQRIQGIDRIFILYTSENVFNGCYGFTAVEKEKNEQDKFVGGTNLSNASFVDAFTKIDGKEYYVMLVDNRLGKFTKVKIEVEGVFSHTFYPDKNLFISLKSIDKLTKNERDDITHKVKVTFYNSQGSDITKEINEMFPTNYWGAQG